MDGRLTRRRGQPAAIRARPANFTSTPTKGISKEAVAAALKAPAPLPPTDENEGPSTLGAPAAVGSVVKPTPKLATGSAAPRPASSLTKPTAASAAKSAAKAVTTPRALASAAKPTPKATPGSAASVSQTDRASLGGRTPTATMTCRVEALDMLEQGNEASLNASGVVHSL